MVDNRDNREDQFTGDRRSVIVGGAVGLTLLALGTARPAHTLSAFGVSTAAQATPMNAGTPVRGVLNILGSRTVAKTQFAPFLAQAEPDVKEIVRGLFKWDAAAAHRYAWQDLPGTGSMIAKSEGPNAPVLRGTSKSWRRFNFGDLDLDSKTELQVSVPTQINPALPGEAQICVTFDPGIIVPDALAAIYSNGFASALAAGWVMNQFRNGEPLPFNTPDLITPQKAELTNYASYGATIESFEKRVEQLADSVPLESHGMFQGWKSAIALQTAPAVTQRAVKAALFSRFNWESLGMVTSHTLHYMLGFHRAGALAPPGGAKGQPNDVSLATLNSWNAAPESEAGQQISQLESAIAELFENMLPLAYAEDVPPGVRANIRSFLVGYNKGAVLASRDVFFEAVQLGYGIGFRFGFRQGYNRGYRDGYRGGFKAGLGDFLDDIVKITKNVKDIVGTVGKVISIFG